MDEKLPTKYAKPSGRNGNRLPLRYPGDGIGGGKKGRSGRPPHDRVAFLQSVTDDPQVREMFLRFARAGSLKHLGLAYEYTTPKPKQESEVSGDVTITVRYVKAP